MPVLPNELDSFLFLLLIILIKSAATTLTFAAGGIGGIFAPSLFTGANGGLFLGLIIDKIRN